MQKNYIFIGMNKIVSLVSIFFCYSFNFAQVSVDDSIFVRTERLIHDFIEKDSDGKTFFTYYNVLGKEKKLLKGDFLVEDGDGYNLVRLNLKRRDDLFVNESQLLEYAAFDLIDLFEKK